MDTRKRSTPSLSSLVQTRSLELVLAPIAKHVSELLGLSNEGGRSVPFPDLMPSTLAIMEAVQDLANVAQKISTESLDEQLNKDIPRVSEIALKAAEQLLEAAGRLSDNPLSQHAKSMLCSASHTLLEGTMKVLLVWDDGEVRKILTAAQWVLDRLGLVQGAKSMRGLVICFGGFSESMLLLLSLADKRQLELTNKDCKQRLLAALERLKTVLPQFSSAMQVYVKSPAVVSAKEAKESLGDELSSAIHELMDAVRPLDREADNMAGNIMEVQRKLTTSSRYFIGPDLDKHLDAIIQNSMAVAHVSRDQYREAIQKLCGEVLSLRKELQDHAEEIYTDPDNKDTKMAFDSTADHLCERLLELDRWVADSVVDQVTEAFVETSVPINHLVQAATSGPHTSGTRSTTTATPASSTSPDSSSSSHHDDSLKGLTKQVDLFRRHSRRLSQVAAYAAQSSTNAKRVQEIKVLADSVDRLTPRVVESAMKVRKEPANKDAREQLDRVRREWAGKVQQLTGAIDDIIDPEDFMAVSEANIQQDMAKCRDAIQSGNWVELNGIVQGIAAKARRILEVGHTAVKNATDHSYKNTLSKAVHRLEKAIPRMLTLCQHVISNPSSQKTQDQFIRSLRELLEGIHDIQSVLSSGIDVPQEGDEEESGEEDVDVFVPKSSTQSKLTPAQERMLKRNIERLKNQPRYIGSLGAAAAKQRGEPPVSRTLPTHPDMRDSRDYGTQMASGDVETQTPHQRTKDQALQVDLPLSDSMDTFSQASLRTSTTSWTTPISPARTSSYHTTPLRVTPRIPDESETMRSYVSPLQKLVTAAKRGDTDAVPSHASQLSARTIRLTDLAESAAETLKPNTELARTLQTRSTQVRKMVPHVIDQAKEVAMDPHQSHSVDELQVSTHQWAGHVRQLVDATQQANLPWSKTADKLVVAAKTGRGIEKQMAHMSTQTNRMVDIATMTIEAAETEEAIGSTDDSDLSQDRELREQVEHVKVTASEIQKLTPRLLSAAEEASVQKEGSATMEHLNLLSQEWATKAKVLMKGVDDVSLGMGGAADTLLLSAKSGDPTLLAEQTKAIQSLAESMEATAKDAIEGCTDSDKIQVVKVTGSNIKKLSTQLIDCANALAEADDDEEESDEDQAKQENSELLRRDWSSQVHLLTAHIDDLTAEVSAPLDRLVDIALQASRTDGMTKEHLLKQFENKASFLTDQLELVNKLFKEATDSLQVREQPVEKVEISLAFLKKLTPHAVGAARSLATDPGSAMLDHFNHLRRQWASKAQFLLANLKRVSSTDMGRVLAAFMDLIHHSKMTADKGTESPLHRPRSYSSDGIGDEKLELDVPEPSNSTNRLSNEASDTSGLRPTPQRTKRPASMAVPLPSWVNKEDEADPYSVSSQSIAVAAQSLREVTDVFFEENNPIVGVAKKMSNQMSQMAEFTRGRGELQSKTEMIHTAKAIAANGQVIARFANVICDNCTDKTIKRNLQYCVEMIPTLSTQLRIIASVKAVTPDDTSADVMLVKNAQNLMRAVIKTVQAAEAACMRGLKPPENAEEQEEQSEAADLARGWKRKLYHQRTLETIQAPRDARGMRKLNRNRISTPSVLDVIKPRQSLMKSPTHKSYKDNF